MLRSVPVRLSVLFLCIALAMGIMLPGATAPLSAVEEQTSAPPQPFVPIGYTIRPFLFPTRPPVILRAGTLHAGLDSEESPYGYLSADNGRTWRPSVGGFVLAEAEGAQGRILFGVRLDDEGYAMRLARSADNGQTWQFAQPLIQDFSNSFEITRVQAADNFALNQTAFAFNGRLWRTTNGGSAWQDISPFGLGIHGFALSPDYHRDRTIFAWTLLQGAFRSTNGGDNWIPVNTGLQYGPNNSLFDIQISPNYATDKRLWARTFQATWTTENGGQSWRRATFNYSVLAVDPRPGEEATLWAADRASAGMLFRSTDSGRTWQPRPVPPGDVEWILRDPWRPHLYLLSFADGLYFSPDDGVTWRMVQPPGMPLPETTMSSPPISNGTILSGLSKTAWVARVMAG
jgi:hypothetical protein